MQYIELPNGKKVPESEFLRDLDMRKQEVKSLTKITDGINELIRYPEWRSSLRMNELLSFSVKLNEASGLLSHLLDIAERNGLTIDED